MNICSTKIYPARYILPHFSVVRRDLILSTIYFADFVARRGSACQNAARRSPAAIAASAAVTIAVAAAVAIAMAVAASAPVHTHTPSILIRTVRALPEQKKMAPAERPGPPRVDRSNLYALLNFSFGCLHLTHFQSSGRSSNATPSCSAGS